MSIPRKAEKQTMNGRKSRALMAEAEVNHRVAAWLRIQHRDFEGFLTKGRDIPAPNGDGSINLDFFSPQPRPWWIESKGENVTCTDIIGALGKVAFCVMYSNGNASGILAAPSSTTDWVLGHEDFFALVFARAFDRPDSVGLFDVQREELIWL